MRAILIAFAAFACFAPLSVTTARADDETGAWMYAYDTAAGMAVARQQDRRGDVAAMFSCRPPNGDLTIADFELGRQRTQTATVRIGDLSITVPARNDRVNGDRALVIPLPQSPPVLAGVREGAVMTISVGNRSHTLAQGAGQKLREVAYACWPRD
ncbi:MAG: hypothetical protein AB7L65_02335 [Hyphomonadaceae bacterium]